MNTVYAYEVYRNYERINVLYVPADSRGLPVPSREIKETLLKDEGNVQVFCRELQGKYPGH